MTRKKAVRDRGKVHHVPASASDIIAALLRSMPEPSGARKQRVAKSDLTCKPLRKPKSAVEGKPRHS
jgi:hypothetical protein